MFSLIITLISIALVAALALATLFYGGSAFEQSTGRAKAATIINQGQQLLGASELFYAERGAWPTSVEELVAEGFLQEAPVAQLAVSNALASQTWTMPMAGQPVFVLPTEASSACRGVNEKVYGMDGILPRLQTGLIMQCYGKDPALRTLYSVAGRNAEHLLEVARSGLAPFDEADISSDPLPSATDESAWLLQPGSTASAGGGSNEPAPGPTPPATPGELSLSVSPSFGNVATNTTAFKEVQLLNVGQSPLALNMPPNLSSTSLFSLAENTCSATLAPSASCTITVAYSPTLVAENDSTVLSFGHGDPVVTEQITLTARAYNPVGLQTATLPDGIVNRAYTGFDFKSALQVTNEALPTKELATWSVTGGALPAGMQLNSATGVLSGTPTSLTESQSFTVEATYKNNKGQQVYVIRVGGVILEVTQITAGGNHTCAVTTSGAAKCWGENGSGQLGDGSTTARRLPVLVSGLDSGVLSIEGGGVHTCAIVAGGAAKCWGANNQGQLGDGSFTNRRTPVNVTGLSSGVSSIVAMSSVTCAVVSGAAKCWGTNTNGQLGDGTTVTRGAPVDVVSLSDGVVKVAPGVNFSCALLSSGGVKCWGYNNTGQLGDGTTTSRLAPADVSSLTSGATDLTVGFSHACAVVSGAAKCWGTNTNGRLGDGSTTARTVPVTVTGLGSGVKTMAAGAGGGQNSHTCAVTNAGAAYCWGSNDNGELGSGNYTSSLTPVLVSGLGSGVQQITAGETHTCALSADAARCWGGFYASVIGDGVLATRRTTPVKVLSE